jgi:hypothetical protein
MDAKTWPAEYERNTDSSWVTRYARPQDGDVHPAVLEERQRQWDASKAKYDVVAKRSAEIQAEREAKLQASQERQAADRQARNQRKTDALTAELKRGYLAAGGTEDDFQKALPELLEQRRRQAAMTGEDRAREAQAALYRSF